MFVQRPVKRGAAHAQKVGDLLAGFAFVDQLPGVVDLLGREARLPAICHMARPVGKCRIGIRRHSRWRGRWLGNGQPVSGVARASLKGSGVP